MTRMLMAIGFIYGCCVFAWLILGGTVVQRTNGQDAALRAAAGRRWGGALPARAPRRGPAPAGEHPLRAIFQ